MGGELGVLGPGLTRPGNIAQMKSMISELLLYGITPEQLFLLAGSKGDNASDLSAGKKFEAFGQMDRDSFGGGSGRAGRSSFVKDSGQADRNRADRASGRTERDRVGGSSGSLLSRKLQDIARIYERFLEEMGERFMTAEEVPEVLARAADRSELLSSAVLALDGFTGFTPVQYVLLKKLMGAAEEMTVAVTIDPAAEPFGKGREGGLFSLSRETIRTLTNLAKEAGAKISWEALTDEGGRFREAPSLAMLESALFRRKRRSFQGTPGEIRLLAAQNPLAEVREAARMIASMVRDHFRYRDFAVITGDLQGYGSLVRQVFREMDIPFFVDEKHSLLRNPLLEYVRAAAQVLAESFSAESMIRLLRSGLTGLSEDAVDRLENYILGAGLRGKTRWHQPIIKPYRDEDPDEISLLEEARVRLLSLLDPLAEAFSVRNRGKKGSVTEKAETLYDFLVRSGAEAELARRADAHEKNGRPDLAREYRQVYGRVLDFLERLVRVLGEEAVSMRDFRALLEAGLAEEKIAIIPPGNDQVLVGDMERSRLGNVKVLFFLGVNEGLVPKPESGGGLLSEHDRELLSGAGIKLKPTARENISISRFYMYLALTKPSRFLHLSYAESDSSGGSLRPSYLVTTLRGIFPDLAVERPPEAAAERIEHLSNAHSLLVEGFSELTNVGANVSFFELFAYFQRNPMERLRLDALLSAVTKRKPADAIGRAAAQVLYGKTLTNSASRLEKFAACEFAQFVRYGLRLRERAEFRFTPMDMGNVVHDALERFGKGLLHDGLDWTDLSNEDRNLRLSLALREAAEGYGSNILEDSPRNAYQTRRMLRLLATSVWAMQEQLRRGDFRPAYYELAFGHKDWGAEGIASATSMGSGNLPGETAWIGASGQAEAGKPGGLPGEAEGIGQSGPGEHLPGGTIVDCDLGNGESLTLIGRIDRVDICQEEYLKIVDYKTGSRAFDIAAFYHGLQLQLVVYLGAAKELLSHKGRQLRPAGMFYFEIKDPVVKADASMTDDELREEILKEMRSSGLVSSDREALLLLDRTLADGGKSMVIPAEVTKAGALSKTSKAVTEEQFDLMLDYAKQKIREIGTKILRGETDVNPYRYRGKTACDYCAYREICGFDPKIGGYRYRELPAMKAEEVFEAIENGEKGG
ncbi:MAG: PD-(D/E)XK nuclease family protein, partial [bacterium]